MKKTLFLMLFYAANICRAYSQTYTQIVDSLFQHLDKTNVTTGILYDRVFPYSNLNDYNILQVDTSYSRHFYQAYNEIYNASYNNYGWLSFKDYEDLARISKLSGKIPVGLGNYEFNIIDTMAIDNNLISMGIDSLYYDVAGRSSHPFLNLKRFVASPLIDSVYGLSVTFDFTSSLIINRSSTTIQSLQVDFNDSNGLVAVSLGNLKSITYGTVGVKYLKFVATFSDLSTVTTYGAIKIKTSSGSGGTVTQGCDPHGGFTIWSKEKFQGYDETIPTKGFGQVSIWYATNGACDQNLRKPIIILDGFDLGDERSAIELYDDYLNNVNRGRLADSLRANGFDIVVLNFPKYVIGGKLRDGGADYIERNGKVLINLIDTINNNLKITSEKLIVIGPSMGGLISRYALAYMEQHSKPHETKLWISFDSPHLGANIPIGDQCFIDYYAKHTGSVQLVADRDNKISSYAARQMLVHHYEALSTTPSGYPGYRNRFLDTLNTLGYPHGDALQPFRKIALVDGSLGGNEVNSAGQRAFEFNVRRYHRVRLIIFKKRLTNLSWTTYSISDAEVFFTPSYGTVGTVFHANFPLARYGNKSGTSPSATSSGYDVAPGGRYTTQQIIYDSGEGLLQSKFGINGGGIRFKALFTDVISDHSFIPTKSALAFTGTMTDNLSENISTRNLVCTGETPFDSYFGSFTTNREHVEVWPAALTPVLQSL